MKKQLLLVTILFMFLSTTLLVPAVIAEEIESQGTFIGLFNSQIAFDNENDFKEPITPGETKTVEFKVKYKLDMGNLIFRLLTKRRIGRLILFGLGHILKIRGDPKASVNLTVECPTWCNAKLDLESVNFAYNNAFGTADVKLEFTLDENAPALVESQIKINAVFPGFWTIKEQTNSTTVSFLPKYVSNLTVDSEIEHTITPLKNYTIPINITNNGNSNSKVNVKIVDDDNWTILLNKDEFTLNTEKAEELSLTIIEPPNNFKDKSFKIIVTPTSTQDSEEASYLQGEKVELTYTFHNDGSVKEKEDEGINLQNIVIIVVVIILLIVLIAFLVKRKK